jgi:hypothetical protein
MLFKELIAVYCNNHTKPVKYKMHNYWKFKQGVHIVTGSRGSSVSIVSDYGLDDRAIEVRSPAEAKGFFL